MDQIRTAVIGFGTAGRVFHAPQLDTSRRFSLDAIVATSEDTIAEARRRYPEAALYTDAADLFANADLYDLAVVATPNATHAPLAHQALAAGLHVLVDKPISVTAAQANGLVDAAHAAGLVLTVFQNRRWDGDFLTLRKAIAQGLVGDVRQFESAFEWWKPELGKAWKDSSSHANGGGILYDLGPHLIDQALQLFGDVVTVHAELDTRREGAAGDDDSFVTLHHASGVRTRLWMNAVAPANRPRFRVVGSTGVLTTWGLDPQEPQSIAGMHPSDPAFGTRDVHAEATIESPDGRTTLALEAGRYRDLYAGLAAAIVDGELAPVDPRDSIRALELIEHAIRVAS